MSRTIPAIAVTNWRPLKKNTLLGFFDLTLTDYGITLRGCTLHKTSGIRWIGYPARPYEKDGKNSWANIVDIPDRDFAREMQTRILGIIDTSKLVEVA